MPDLANVTEQKSKKEVPKAAIRKELERILESPLFAQSDRLSRFLRFTVENTLQGKAELLKEYAIGTEVYDRKAPYHPSEDSIVRTEARRLRGKLKEYYESIGKNDPIYIYYRPGTYVPLFRSHEDKESEEADRVRASMYSDGPGVPVAVLPFTDASGTALSGMCAHGITDELTHQLVQTEGIRVTAASSVNTLLGQSMDVPGMAQKLNVQVVFEGTVREEENKLRITSRIVNADGFQLWSHRFETEPQPKSLFDVSEQIASALVSRVRPELSMIRKGKASAGASILSVYPLVLSAEALLDQSTVPDIHVALAKFQEAAQLQPDYARPRCGISQCYSGLALRGIPDSAGAVKRAKEEARRALEMDREMTLVPAAMACAAALSWEWADAEEHFEASLRLGQNAATLREYALLLAALGRSAEAWDYAQQAQQIDPFSHRQKLVYAKLFHLTRRYKEGAEHFANRSLYGTSPAEEGLYRALILVELRRIEEAKQLAVATQTSAGAQVSVLSVVAEILAMCGEVDAARKIAEDFQLHSRKSPISKFRQALLHLALGDVESAFSLLGAAYEEHEAELIWFGQEPRLERIRGDERHRSLLEKIMGSHGD
jgi:TolB-like protein/Tfp pilus assembly protein PilF